MTVDFNSILNTRVDEIEKPKPLPMGSFVFQVGQHEFGESSQKKTPMLTFKVTPKSPGEDVDEDLLAEVKNWQEKELKLNFFLTDDAMFRLKDFLEHCGIETAGRTLGECIPEVSGALFTGYVKHETAQNNVDVFAQISSTSPAE